MIPQSGSINIIGSTGNLGTTNLTGTLTGTTVIGSNRLLVTTTPPAALDGIRTQAGLFINDTTDFPAGTRIIAQRSPTAYNITGVSWASGVTTLTVDTMPLAPVNNMLIYIEGASEATLNATYTASGTHSTTTIQFAQAVNPGTGFTGGRVFPGIVNSVTGTGSGGIGYYTTNLNALAAVTAAAISTTTRTPFQITTGTTHVIPISGTAAFANIILDGVGVVPIPCNQLVAIKNLKGGSYVMASGAVSGTDVLSFIQATYNPLGNP